MPLFYKYYTFCGYYTMKDLYKVFTFDRIQSVYNDIVLPKWEWYYKINKGIYAAIEEMTAKEYLTECAKARGSGTYKTEYNSTNSGNVKNIAERIKQGKQFSAPVVDYVNHTQDGRHRCLACDSLGYKNIPVVCIHNWDVSLQHKELKLKPNYYISKGFLYDSKDSSFVRGPIPYMNKKEVVEYLKDYIK